MRALIIKDFYNLNRYIKSMIFMITIFAVIFINSNDIEGIITVSSILFGMMIMNAFTFDDMCNWERFCLTTPIRKKDIVISKFIILLLLSLLGLLVGFLATILGNLFLSKPINGEFFGTMGILTIISFSISLIFGSTIMPIIYKFGVEKARNFLILSYIIPIAVGAGILKILFLFGFVLTEKVLMIIIIFSPLIAFVWTFIMYIISLKIFEKKEF